MVDEKDRFGDKLREIEKAREDQWAWEQDRKLLEQIRQRVTSGTFLCPKCHEPLTERREQGIVVMACPKDDGAWLDAVTLKALLAKNR